jgi:hypothetical protein
MIYEAPRLILHYIRSDQYLPPREFRRSCFKLFRPRLRNLPSRDQENFTAPWNATGISVISRQKEYKSMKLEKVAPCQPDD